MKRQAYPDCSIIRLLCAGALGLFVVAGCVNGTPTEGPGDAGGGADTSDMSCDTRMDCPIGFECIAGVCEKQQTCQERGECPSGMVCIDRVCQKEIKCSRDSECTGQRKCIEGICQPECTRDDDCPDGQACVFQECTGGDTGPVSDADAGDADVSGDADAGTCGCRLPTDAGPGKCVAGDSTEACGSGGEVCEICKENETCESGECKQQQCDSTTCSNGCCNNGTCEPGDEHDLCGSGGQMCIQCKSNEKCESGSCVPACDSQSCAGCCTSKGKCLQGTMDSACGANGASCTKCDPSKETCANGKCIKLKCQKRCNNGCCTGNDKCLSGTKDSACGSGGGKCWQCPKGWACQSQTCAVLDYERWDVIGIRGKVPKTDENAVFWDNRWNKPDVYLKVTVNGATQTISGKTKAASGDLTPTWKETTATDVRADDLKGFQNVVYELWDEDPLGDDRIAKCKKSFSESDFTGSTVTISCEGAQNGPRPIDTTIEVRLQYHP